VKVAKVETIPVSVPYRHREVSAQVARDGVSDVLVKVTTDDGLIGWGEACCGADTASVDAALQAMTPFVVERDPWNREAMRRDAFTHGLWQFRSGTGNFAWAGIDMALWDVCGRACGQPLWHLLGGLQQKEATYFYYLARGTPESLAEQVDDGLQAGFEVFYLKVGLDDAEDLEMVSTVRQALGANEGLWSEADTYARIRARDADVYCFSPYWVGSIGSFHRLSWLAAYEGLLVCKHTHGELGLAAAAGHHVVLTVPNGVEGHQQSAYLMEHDILTETIPIARGPRWGTIDGPGLGVDVDEEAVEEAAARFRIEGQYRPWQDYQIATEER